MPSNVVNFMLTVDNLIVRRTSNSSSGVFLPILRTTSVGFHVSRLIREFRIHSCNTTKMSEKGKQMASFPAPSTSSAEIHTWIEAQDMLKVKLIKEDEFTWKIAEGEGSELKYVAGVDISFSKEEPAIACGTLVVLDLQTFQVVYDDFSIVTVQVPYVPGFLAFREAPVLLELLERMKKVATHFYPQLLMVDGNGVLHPRGFGLACHLGVTANLPTIGIGKNLHHVDGLTQSSVRQLLQSKDKNADYMIPLMGLSGCIWGMAMRSTLDSSKPIYVSIGHRVSLDTAIRIVKMTCKYRVPEPIRQADIRSREYLRKFQMGMFDNSGLKLKRIELSEACYGRSEC